MQRSIRLYWDTTRGWVLDTPMLMTESHLKNVIKRLLLPPQVDRYRSLPPGDKKEQLKAAIEQLRLSKVQQRLVSARGDSKGDLLVFAAPRRDGHQQYSIGRA